MLMADSLESKVESRSEGMLEPGGKWHIVQKLKRKLGVYLALHLVSP